MNKLVLVSMAFAAVAFAHSAALARGGGGHASSPSQHAAVQHPGSNNSGPTTKRGVKSAAKINPLAGEVIGKKVLSGVIEGGRAVGGALGTVGGALSSGGSSCQRCR